MLRESIGAVTRVHELGVLVVQLVKELVLVEMKLASASGGE
jgi:hypothetical protein